MARKGSVGRRAFLKLGAGATAAIAAPTMMSIPLRAQAGTQPVTYQLCWLASGNNLGEVVAKRLGYHEAEKLDLKIQPGGPSIDGVAVVATGRTDIGQASSSPSIMRAISQDLPIKCFATGAQQHPFTYFSLKKAPIRTPQDMIGKKDRHADHPSRRAGPAAPCRPSPLLALEVTRTHRPATDRP